MDEIVLAAMRKWPSVPHCYGWLALDARGQWRMRDAACQAAGTAGDVIAHAGLRAFIERNYLCTENGAWYFQNGPQRVYVDLEDTPYVLRFDPAAQNTAHRWQLHTGGTADVRRLFCSAAGHLYGMIAMDGTDTIARLDDRDLPRLLQHCVDAQGSPLDESFFSQLPAADASAAVIVIQGAPGTDPAASARLPMASIDPRDLPTRYGFLRQPRPSEDTNSSI